VYLCLAASDFAEIASCLVRWSIDLCQGRLLLVGGGGYRLENVVRCWAEMLARVCDVALPDTTPWADAPDIAPEEPAEVAVAVDSVLRALRQQPATGGRSTPRFTNDSG